MSISFVEGVQSTGLSATLSTAPPAGSLLIAVNTNQSSDAGIAAGWTQIDALDASIWDAVTAWKICGASESATQTPFTGTSGNISLTRFDSTNGFPASPIDVHSIKQGTTGTPPSVTSTSVTPSTANNALFVQGFQNSASDTAPASVAGMTKIISLSGGTSGSGANFYQIAAGTSAITKTMTWTGSSSGTPYITAIVVKENVGGSTGTLSKTLGAAAISASGTAPAHGALAKTLGAAALMAAGTNLNHGTLSKTLGAATVAASGTNLDHGTAVITLGAATLVGIGTDPVAGSAAIQLGAATLAASGTSADTGTLAVTLDAAGIVAEGAAPARGALGQSLGAATLVAHGGVLSPVSGSANIQLAATALVGVGFTGSTNEVKTEGMTDPYYKLGGMYFNPP